MHTVTPHIVCDGAAEAIEFYSKAFGAVEVMRQAGPHGKLIHASIRIGDSAVMLVDESPEWGSKGPAALARILHQGATKFVFCEVLQPVTRILAGNEVFPSPLSGFWLVLHAHLERYSANHRHGYALRSIVQAESSSPHPKIRILMQYAG